ncbi:MAG: FecR family protein [Ginsengibacter sp.]
MHNKKAEKQLQSLIRKYCEGKANEKEVEFLNLYYKDFEKHPGILTNKTEEEKAALKAGMEVNIMNRILFENKINKNKAGPVILSMTWFKMAAAASVILIVSAVFFFLKPASSKQISKNESGSHLLKNDAAPGGNKAILTLANGSNIILDSVHNGTLSSQGTIKIIKVGDGQLAYSKAGEEIKDEVVFNTITTPKGGQYQLTLADGSKVWLNAASSLHYPVAFSGNERKVELTGEGYFEVAKNKEKPFIVSVNNTEVEVLGTHFNVNAYTDESSIRTTLLEGSVKVSKGNTHSFIVPGEQASISKESDEMSIIKNVNLEETVAWKNGIFQFSHANIETIMRQVARWYDVDVSFESGIPDKRFDGKFYRNVNASEVFKILEEGGIHINIVGKKVIVSP